MHWTEAAEESKHHLAVRQSSLGVLMVRRRDGTGAIETYYPREGKPSVLGFREVAGFELEGFDDWSPVTSISEGVIETLNRVVMFPSYSQEEARQPCKYKGCSVCGACAICGTYHTECVERLGVCNSETCPYTVWHKKIRDSIRRYSLRRKAQ